MWCKIWNMLLKVFNTLIEGAVTLIKGVGEVLIAVADVVTKVVGNLLDGPAGWLVLAVGGYFLLSLIGDEDSSKEGPPKQQPPVAGSSVLDPDDPFYVGV